MVSVRRRTYIIDNTVKFFINNSQSNPLYYKSVIGSADLFYDAIVNNAAVDLAYEIRIQNYNNQTTNYHNLTTAAEILPFVNSYIESEWKDVIYSAFDFCLSYEDIKKKDHQNKSIN
jgi:hypothetical protein